MPWYINIIVAIEFIACMLIGLRVGAILDKKEKGEPFSPCKILDMLPLFIVKIVIFIRGRHKPKPVLNNESD